MKTTMYPLRSYSIQEAILAHGAQPYEPKDNRPDDVQAVALDGQHQGVERNAVLNDRTCFRGVTLIEAVLYVSVALGLIIGGLVFYQQAARAAVWQDVRRVIEVSNTEVRALYQVTKWHNQATGINTPGFSSELIPVLAAMGAIPQSLVAPGGNTIELGYGGDMGFVQRLNNPGTAFEFRLSFNNVPEWLCTRLVVVNKVNHTDKVGNGVVPFAYMLRFYPSGSANIGSSLWDHHVPEPYHLRASAPLVNGDGTTTRGLSIGPLPPGLAASHCRDTARASSTGLIGVEITSQF